MSDLVYRTLGKTGLQVSPLGIGGGSGISNADLLYAFECGINYFFFSSDLHHFFYQKSAQALKKLCGQGSSVRERVVLATVSYVNNPNKLPAVLTDLFSELGVDYIDVFHWGWITEKDDLLPLLKKTEQLKSQDSILQMLYLTQEKHLHQEEQAQEVNAELVKRGLVRFVGASFHSRAQARRWMRNLDVLMLRYNACNMDMEHAVTPFLSGDKRHDPGIVVFNTNRPALLKPKNWHPGQPLPSIKDCYRFALFQPWVDLVLTGPASRAEIDQALEAVALGPLEEEEQAALLRYRAQYEGHLVAQ